MTTDRDTVIPCAQPAWHTHSYPYFTPPEHLALCLATSADPASGYRTPVAAVRVQPPWPVMIHSERNLS